jgi:hypothetical protein
MKKLATILRIPLLIGCIVAVSLTLINDNLDRAFLILILVNTFLISWKFDDQNKDKK